MLGSKKPELKQKFKSTAVLKGIFSSFSQYYTNFLHIKYFHIKKRGPEESAIKRRPNSWTLLGYKSLMSFPPCYSQSPVHCKKMLAIFPSPAGMSLTKLSLAEKVSA
jgi:hypothetical protein